MYEHLSIEDYLVWTHVVQAVIPIGEKNKLKAPWERGQVASVTSALPARNNALKALKEKHNWLCPCQEHHIDRRTAGRSRRGRLSIESSLDLHGFGQTRAHVALRCFVERAWRLGLRSVLVITGKGTRANGGIGVLRAAVPLWLNEPDLRPKVLSFSYAQPRDGGEGALYLLIRRRRVDSSAA